MPKLSGVLNPANVAEDTGGGFKEGTVRVDAACFKVHPKKGDGGAVVPTLALVWNVTRLDQDTHEPIDDGDGGAVKDELVFGLGNKTLGVVTPGLADSPDDVDVQDAGTELNAEGPTLYISDENAAKGWKLHPKTALAILNESLKKVGWKPEIMDRTWAPDFVGSVLEVTNWTSPDKMMGADGKEHAITYKIVKAAPVRGYEQKGKKAKADAAGAGKGSAASGSAKSGDGDKDKAAVAVLKSLSEAKAGAKLTRKALLREATTMLNGNGSDPKMMVPVLERLKDDKWLGKNIGLADGEFDAEEGTVAFGE
jgi:hypothetical protein